MMAAVRACLQQLDGVDFDLCVLGGSVFGAAVAWLAAAAGAKVALVAAGDIGATNVPRSQGWLDAALSWSSGGEGAHAVEALRERDELLRGAPHLARAIACDVAVPDHAAASALVANLRRWREGTLPAATVAATPRQPGAGLARVAAFDGVRDEPALARASVAAARACGAVVATHAELVGLGVRGLTLRDAMGAAATATLRTRNVLVADDEQPDRVLAALKLPALATPRVQCGAWCAFGDSAISARGWFGAVDGGVCADLPGHERRVVSVTDVEPSVDPAQVLASALAQRFGEAAAVSARLWRRIVPAAWRRDPTIAGDVHLWPWRSAAPLAAARAYVAATLRAGNVDLAALGAGVAEPLSPWWRRHGARGVAWRERHAAPAVPLCPHRSTDVAAIAFAVGDDVAVGFLDVLRRIDPDGVPCLREECLRQAHAAFLRARRELVDGDAATAVADARRTFPD